MRKYKHIKADRVSKFVCTKTELRKLAPLWGNEELTVTVTSIESL